MDFTMDCAGRAQHVSSVRSVRMRVSMREGQYAVLIRLVTFGQFALVVEIGTQANLSS